MVPENRKERLMGARAVVASKRARAQAAQAAGEGADAGSAADAAVDAEAATTPLPLQAREVSAAEQPRAHTTCKRCAATVLADATECWNCSLPL